MEELAWDEGIAAAGDWIAAALVVAVASSISCQAPHRPVASSRACYLEQMNAVRGRVRGGHVETDAALPEGAEVVVLTVGDDGPFDLDDDQLAELETRMTEADRGEVEPAEDVLGRLHRSR